MIPWTRSHQPSPTSAPVRAPQGNTNDPIPSARVTDVSTCSAWSSANQNGQQAYAETYLHEHGSLPGGSKVPANVIAAINNGCGHFDNDVQDNITVVQASSSSSRRRLAPIGWASVRPSRILVAVMAAFALLPAVALAHRRATKAERTAILTAVVRQHQLSKAQAACQVVRISTVNERYALLAWPRKLSSACEKVAANGVIIEHRGTPGWRFVTVGSSFRCPIRNVPARVARDLGVCP